VARRLAERGARNLVLAGRGEPGEAARAAITELEKEGVRVAVVRADVARPEDAERLLREAEALAPVRGVVHAAGVLDDGVLLQQSWARFVPVLAPKVGGAWQLDRLTRGRPLDFFVLFSSVAGLVGSPAQGNYAAGNAFLDALAQARRAEGLPAVSIDWGPWAGAGMAVRPGPRGSSGSAQGFEPLPPELALDALERLILGTPPQVAVLSADWAKVRASFPAGSEPPVLGALAAAGGRRTEARQSAGDGELLRRLQAAPPAERREMLLGQLQELTGRALGRGPSQPVDPEQPLRDMGFDSLMAVELRNGVNQGLGRNFPATLLFDFPTLDALAGFLIGELFPPAASAAEAPTPVPPAPAPEPAPDQMIEDVAGMSEEELDRDLAEHGGESLQVDDLR
jgi:polyketide synthase 12/myxalamid-type polyketide synthase MxaB